MDINPQLFASFFKDGVFPEIQHIVSTLYERPEVLWMVLPLFISTVFIGFYFGRHKTEELGWNTAFGNTISLLWVTTGLVRFLYEKTGSWDVFLHPGEFYPVVAIVVGLGIWGLILAFFNYYHTLPKLVSFFISSSVPVNITALLAIVIIVGEIPVTLYSLSAAFFLFVAIAMGLAFLKALWKPSKEAAVFIEEYKKNAAKAKEKRERAVHHRAIQFKRHCVARCKATFSTMKGFFGLKK